MKAPYNEAIREFVQRNDIQARKMIRGLADANAEGLSTVTYTDNNEVKVLRKVTSERVDQFLTEKRNTRPIFGKNAKGLLIFAALVAVVLILKD